LGAIIKEEEEEEEEEYIVLSTMNKSVYSRKPEIFKKKKKLFNLLMSFSKVFNFLIMHVVFIALYYFFTFGLL
jgi:hypothetical protein